MNVDFFGYDATLTAEDVFLGLPIPHHHGVDTKTLFEERRHILDRYDFSAIRTPGQDGNSDLFSRLIIARLNRVTEKKGFESTRVTKENESVGFAPVKRETSIDYYEVREEEDPFPAVSNLHALHIDQKNDIDRGCPSC